ncbi:MAG: TolC family protein [Proteobacteria bacterium]|nr:TolC family protein [Pseudomonadota bacterium]MBS0494428.1 TolC family protein [Pseudomonadota bacterium]
MQCPARWRRLARRHLLMAAMVLGGCASYGPKPLPTQPDLAVVAPGAAPQAPAAAGGRAAGPARGLDVNDIATAAVLRNPDLKLARDAAGLAQAQAFAAGLLPDPQLSLTRDFPSNGGPANVSAFNLGLSYDITALLVRPALSAAAQAQERQARLDLLWQEWQVISRARTLFVALVAQRQLAGVLEGERALLATQYERSLAAQRQGNMTQTAAMQQLAALQDIGRRVNETQRQIEKIRQDLNALLGLAPDVRLELKGDGSARPITPAAVQAALHRLPQCRPDLLALQAGYQGQEERLRGAILAQFPSLSIGITRARDTSNLYSSGFGITINLPIFNRNRGAIAVQTATRQQLYDAYQNRLNAAHGDTQRLLADRELLQQQLVQVRRGATGLEQALQLAQPAFDAGNLDLLSYGSLRTALLNKRAEALALSQSVAEADVALQTLVGCGDADVTSQSPQSAETTP